MLPNEPTTCLFCLGETARLGRDKKGRPFMHCIACGARAFLPSFSPCLHGVAILGPLARAIVDEAARDRDAWMRMQATIGAYLDGLRAEAARAAEMSSPRTKTNDEAVVLQIARPR